MDLAVLLVEEQIRQLVGKAVSLLIRTVLILMVKLVFKVRDVLVAAMNMICMAVLIPLDLALVVIYVILEFHKNKIFDHEGGGNNGDTTINLNVARRLFWSGKQVSISSDFRNLEVPNEIDRVSDELIQSAEEPHWQMVSYSWRLFRHCLTVFQRDGETMDIGG